MVAKTKTKSKASHNTSQVYSYIRFSTPEQKLGDSQRRQLTAARTFAESETELKFNETLEMIDAGRSAYHGHHRKKGVLGMFLRSVENGDVTTGSILCVENADRLSREGVGSTLRDIIFKLFDKGITLVTLSPKEWYEPGCEDDVKFLALLLYLARAHDESLRKAGLSKANWQQKREKLIEHGVKMTAHCPGWLKPKKNKEGELTDFDIKDGAKSVLRLIFTMKLQGQGKVAITKKLNSEKTVWQPPRKKGWTECYIQKIFNSRSLIGEYQPHKQVKKKNKAGEFEDVREPAGPVIANYYPAALDEGLFHKVQALMKRNTGQGGQTGRATNLFTGIARCGYCGGVVTPINKGGNRGYFFLCENGRKGIKCSSHRISYSEVENIVLKSCVEIKPEQILSSADKQSQRCQLLRERISGHTAKLRAKTEQVDNLMANLTATKIPAMVERYEKQIAKYDDEILQIKKQKANDEKELQIQEQNGKSLIKWKKDLTLLQKEISKNNNAELRLRLRMHLREFIEKIEIFADGPKPSDCNINFIQLQPLLDKIKTKMKPVDRKLYTAFCRYAKKRIVSSPKTGRFLRIFFKSKSEVTFWPSKSVPYDLTLYIDWQGDIDWHRTGSNIKWLWDEFQKSRK